DTRGALAAGIRAQQLRDAHQFFWLAPAHFGDDLRRVARKVALQNLEDAVGVLQRQIVPRLARLLRPELGRGACLGSVTVNAVFLLLRRSGLLLPAPRISPVPFLRVVLAGRAVGAIAAEEAREVFSVAEAVIDDDRRVRVREYVLLEPLVVRED